MPLLDSTASETLGKRIINIYPTVTSKNIKSNLNTKTKTLKTIPNTNSSDTVTVSNTDIQGPISTNTHHIHKLTPCPLPVDLIDTSRKEEEYKNSSTNFNESDNSSPIVAKRAGGRNNYSSEYTFYTPTPVSPERGQGPARKRKKYELNSTNNGLVVSVVGNSIVSSSTTISSSSNSNSSRSTNTNYNTINSNSSTVTLTKRRRTGSRGEFESSDMTEALVPQLNRNTGDIGAHIGPGIQNNLVKNLTSVPLFRNIPEEKAKQIASSMIEQSFQPGQNLFQQGDPDSAFYIIISGEAEVLSTGDSHRALKPGSKCYLTKPTRIGFKSYPAKTAGTVDKFDEKRNYPYTFRVDADGARGRVADHELAPVDLGDLKVIALLRPGDYCGEQAILKQSYRSATVRASTNIRESLVCAMLSREKFLSLNIHHLVHFPERKAVRAVDLEYDERLRMNDNAKSPEQAAWLRDCILKNQTLADLGQHIKEHVDAMVSVAYQATFRQGDVVMQAGDLFATEFYVLESGKFEGQFDNLNESGLPRTTGGVNNVNLCKSDHDRIQAGQLKKAITEVGSSFGEIALIHMQPREVTVTCVSQSATVWVIDRLAFKSMLYYTRKDAMKKIVTLINEIPTFNCLLHDERELLAETLYEKHYIKNEFIMKKGSPCDMFFIVVNGVVNVDGVLVDCHQNPKGDLQCGRGIFFGEDSLLKGIAGTHTVVAHSDDVDVLCLSKRDFEHILGSLGDLILHHESSPSTERTSRTKLPESPTLEAGHRSDLIPKELELENLKRVGVLGIGGFGYVTLEEYNSKTYALKKISKAYIMKSKMTKSIMNEKKIHFMCNSDFIIRLYATFKDATALFLLLEPALGGELYHTYHKNRFHGSGTKARFYVATALTALDHLHTKKVLYRDLKPENLLLDHNGLCKMTDMGLAKQCVGKTYTSCGTPDYFAPEIIAHAGYTETVDWWTVGVLTHELLSGHAPFESPNPQQTYAKVRRGICSVTFPYEKNYPEAVEFVKSMLNREPSQRLASLPGGIDNCKHHPFYTAFDFNWDKFLQNTFPVPYKPQVNGPKDLSNFKQREDATPKKFDLEYIDPKNGWDNDW